MVARQRRAVWHAATIRALRAHLGLTQQSLADELGTRQATVSDWERGLYAPRGASSRVLDMVAERAGLEYGAAGQDEGTPR